MGRRCISWGNTVGGCTRPLVSIFPHRPTWVWISLYRLLPLPWKVPVIPHGHVCNTVSSLPYGFLIHWEWIPKAKTGQHKNSPATNFFFFLQ